ncbi:NAD(P)-binding protein [Aspergillus carlsbadensis]|nr:NAD(P)-binding protein [Aspergillus carlsbadensis]
MHVLVIGGTGRTGKLVIEELLSRGHEVTTLARNPAALGDPRPKLNIVQGTPTNLPDIRSAFNSPKSPRIDAVISTLNAPRATDSPFAAPISPPTLMADCTRNILTGMRESAVRKIVIMQAFGVGDSWSNMNCMLQLFMRKSNMYLQYEDHGAVEGVIKESEGVEYVLVRPCRLVESGERTVKAWPGHGRGVPLMASASRVGVAGFLVDAIEGTEWDGMEPVISN